MGAPDPRFDEPAKGGAGSVVSVRFAADELERLRATANREQVPLSTVVRRAVVAHGSLAIGVSNSATSASSTTTLTGSYSVWGDADLHPSGGAAPTGTTIWAP